MSDYIEEKQIGKYTIAISYDYFTDSPRTWDNLGKFLTWNRGYNSPDKNELKNPGDLFWSIAYDNYKKLSQKEIDRLEENSYTECWDQDQMEHAQELAERFALILPVYTYEHGAITYNTTGFPCPWDSGQAGFIYIEYKKILQEFGRKKLSKKLINKAREILKGEVKTYDQFANNEVYYCEIKDEDGEVIDSCGGYYDQKYAMSEAESNVRYYMDQDKKEAQKLDQALVVLSHKDNALMLV